MDITDRDLIDIYTGEVYRKATAQEAEESDAAGAEGAIHVTIEGREATCYVEA